MFPWLSRCFPDGASVAGVMLSLYDADADERRAAVSYAESDNEGRFSITGLRGRWYRLKGSEFRLGGGASPMVDVASDDRRDVIITITPPTRLP
jgi:hypothetical protein